MPAGKPLIEKFAISKHVLSKLPDNSVKIFNSSMVLFSADQFRKSGRIVDPDLSKPVLRELHRILVPNGRLCLSLEKYSLELAK